MSSFIVRLILVVTTLCAVPLVSYTLLFSSDFLGTVLAVEYSQNLFCDDIVPDNVEIAAKDAIESIHDDIDENDDGHISLQEGSQVNDEGGKRTTPIEGIVSDSDGQMTRDEFWEKWKMSPVYNWTVEEMCLWIASDDVLSHYEHNFRECHINGSFMPIFAEKENTSSPLMMKLFNDPNAVKGVSTSQVRRKLQHKAWGIVLWGYKPPQESRLKDVLLAILLVATLAGVAYSHRVKCDHAEVVKHMKEQMERLEHEYKKMDQQEDEAWSGEHGAIYIRARPSDTESQTGSSDSLESDSSTRYQELCDELADVRRELKDAERRLEEAYDSKWQPPSRLIARLKQTYSIEAKYYQERKVQSKLNMERTSKQMQKIQSRGGGFFQAFRVLHGQADKIDIETQKTIQEMKDIRKEYRDLRERWEEIETLCGTTLRKTSQSLRDQTTDKEQSLTSKSARSSTAPSQLNLPSSSTPTVARRSIKSTLERSEAGVVEVDNGGGGASNSHVPPLEKLQRNATFSSRTNQSCSNNHIRQYPSSSMIHGATTAFKFKEYKRRSVDDDLPATSSSMRQSPSMPQQIIRRQQAAAGSNSRPSSAGPASSSLGQHQRTMSSVSLPEVGYLRNGGVSSRVERHGGDKSGSPLPTIDNSDDASSDASETVSIDSTNSSGKPISRRRKIKDAFRKIKTKLK